ncbi:MAG: hypothetical protein ACK5MT_18080 [Actinomycetales bacterium]
MSEDRTFELTLPPNYWPVELRDGRQIVVIAHAYSVEGDEVVFSLLCQGTPDFEIESLRIPLELLPEGFS